MASKRCDTGAWAAFARRRSRQSRQVAGVCKPRSMKKARSPSVNRKRVPQVRQTISKSPESTCVPPPRIHQSEGDHTSKMAEEFTVRCATLPPVSCEESDRLSAVKACLQRSTRSYEYPRVSGGRTARPIRNSDQSRCRSDHSGRGGNGGTQCKRTCSDQG